MKSATTTANTMVGHLHTNAAQSWDEVWNLWCKAQRGEIGLDEAQSAMAVWHYDHRMPCPAWVTE